jgi:hypothetical protein
MLRNANATFRNQARSVASVVGCDALWGSSVAFKSLEVGLAWFAGPRQMAVIGATSPFARAPTKDRNPPVLATRKIDYTGFGPTMSESV